MTHRSPRTLFFAATLATTTLVAGTSFANPTVAAPHTLHVVAPIVTPVLFAGRNLLGRALLRSTAALGLLKVAAPLLTSAGRPACSNHVGKGMPMPGDEGC